MVRIIDISACMIVCICNRITEAEVRQAARCGAPTPEAAYASAGCEVQCGCCLDYAQEVIDEELGARRPHLRLVA
jgi:bacterioferritin-associated ferredoxin